MTKQVENTAAVGIFLSSKKAQLPAMRITEQPRVLTKSKINRSGCKFSTYSGVSLSFGVGGSRSRVSGQPNIPKGRRPEPLGGLGGMPSIKFLKMRFVQYDQTSTLIALLEISLGNLDTEILVS